MSPALPALRYLLLQVRNPGDPMRAQEVQCFADVLGCDPARIAVHDLLGGAPTPGQLDRADVVLLGGSGDYSVAEGGPWLEPALDGLRTLAARAQPTFASCWGFQAVARALGGTVVTDLDRAELGTLPVRLTDAGRADPVFGPLGPTFHAQMGHQDVVTRLPEGAVRLASTDKVANQAFRLDGLPVYCTQFHPELGRATMLGRLRAYPTYIERILGLTVEQFAETLADTPETEALLPRFIRHVFSP
ncbi:MAG: type 1 glutamine amidotransferase [Rhodothermales bacterium]|nr:type 1 glutamine amidotransferase [Rhodothermales bacterium]